MKCEGCSDKDFCHTLKDIKSTNFEVIGCDYNDWKWYKVYFSWSWMNYVDKEVAKEKKRKVWMRKTK